MTDRGERPHGPIGGIEDPVLDPDRHTDGHQGQAGWDQTWDHHDHDGYAADPSGGTDGGLWDEHEYADEHLTQDGGSRRGARHASRSAGRAGPARAARRLLVFVVAIGLIATAGFAAVTVLRPMVSGLGGGQSDYPGPGSGAVTVVVSPGDTGRTIGQTLADAGVVLTAKAFSDAAQDNPVAGGIQPGTYILKKEMKAADAVTFLADPANRSVKNVTIREGLWASETFAALAKASGKPVSEYQAAAKNVAALGLPAGANGNIEGYLFPATYDFAPDSTPADQLKTMVQKAVSTLTGLGVTPENMEKTVVTASILEAEGSNTDDREKIARVLLNRLDKGMNLQLDSTVSYGVQKRSITTTDAARADKNPYNTYLNAGLPSGPIGNPGADAIQAALHPADGPWLFFVAVNPSTGETKFAVTAAEHDQNVLEFHAWCSANPGKC